MSLKIDLTGKLALVTGAAAGIGRGIAEVLVQSGANVIINDIDAEAGEQCAETLGLRFINADVSSEEAVSSMVSTITEQYGALHILVNNAGIAMFNGIEHTTSSEWDRVVDVNLKGIYCMTRACLPLLKISTSASVINIASVHARMTVSTMTAYAASKGGMLAMTRSMSQELGPFGIRVNTISPGFVDTPLFRDWLSSEPDQAASLQRVHDIIPVGYIASRTEVGALAAFLSSDLARSINGADYLIDGGLTTRLMH